MPGATLLPGHVVQAGDPVLFAVLVGGVVVSSLLVALGVSVWSRRRSAPYLLVALALGTLVAKGFVGLFAMADVFSMPAHHTVEHTLDLLMGTFLVGAIVFARRTRTAEDL
ncbi:DUF7471 family protein [Halomarina ordinaria]|uniref:Uncharacterized protein n=1 Tax=Halomarina ordinaria TaxID=3033939 RepID=A0ABD5U5V2_9EURY|nr:hypothetical protein [Halomarina sp. PSRA2]